MNKNLHQLPNFSTRLNARAERRTFVVRPRIRVRPIHELLIDPRKQADRRVRERVPERLRLRRLLGEVPPPLRAEPRRAREARFLLGRVGRHRVAHIA